jgi:DNA adenine methylase
MKTDNKLTFLRYPGGKQRHLCYFAHFLQNSDISWKRYVEPFLGGGSVFFFIEPEKALLSDKNQELINLYHGIRDFPEEVWEKYKKFPNTKRGYYSIRSWNPEDLDVPTKAARTLYLNRTCFKGMWRHNANGEFNVGYGGQDRRWAICEENLKEVSERLGHAEIRCDDFENIIKKCSKGDLLFLDPPYRPHEREEFNDHYGFGQFEFQEQQRLANTLIRASRKGVKWVMTNSNHQDILDLYDVFFHYHLEKGTGKSIGKITGNSGEVVIHNIREAGS